MHEGHAGMVWVEQSSNFFPRRLYCLQKSFLFISSYRAQQLAAPQLLHTWGCCTWEGDPRRSPHCARQACMGGSTTTARAGSSSWDRCDTEGSGLNHPASPCGTSCSPLWPQCHCGPECTRVPSPCPGCAARHYQPPRWLWQTAGCWRCSSGQMQPSLGHTVVEKQEKSKDV